MIVVTWQTHLIQAYGLDKSQHNQEVIIFAEIVVILVRYYLQGTSLYAPLGLSCKTRAQFSPIYEIVDGICHIKRSRFRRRNVTLFSGRPPKMAKERGLGIKQHDLRCLTNAVLGCLLQDERHVGMQSWLGAPHCHVYLGHSFGGKEGSISRFSGDAAVVTIPLPSLHVGSRDAAPAFLGRRFSYR